MSVPQKWNGKELVREWEYRNTKGITVGAVARYENDEGKECIPFFRPNGKPGIPSDIPIPLYGKVNTESTFIVEGEKCVDALLQIGVAVVTSQGGSSSASKADWSPLKAVKKVYIWPDNDEPGRHYCRDVIAILYVQNADCDVRIVGADDLPEHGDVVDWIQAQIEWDGYIENPQIASLKNELRQRAKKARPADKALFTEDPQPLDVNESSAPDYPLDALGSILSNAAKEIAGAIQVPAFLAGQSILAAAALVCQGLANVLIDGRTIPLSLFLLSVAESGERKSATDKVALLPCSEWEKQSVEGYELELAEFHAAEKANKIAEKELIGKRKSSHSLADTLSALPAPQEPMKPGLIASEPTLEGIYRHFKDGMPVLGLYSDEGGQFFGGHAMNQEHIQKTISGLSSMWDGAPIRRMRATKGESWTGFDKRLSLHLLVQHEVVQPILSNSLLWNQGVLARFLPAFGQDLFGKRMYREVNPYTGLGVRTFHRELRTRLGELEVIVEKRELRLDAEAKAKWIEAHDHIEQMLPGDLADIRPVAAKMAEQILRIAGVLTVMAGGLEIHPREIANAMRLVNYYADIWLIIRSQAEQDTTLLQAKHLLEWIHETKFSRITSREICRQSPRKAGCKGNASRTRARMAVLVEYGWAVVDGYSKEKKASSWIVRD